MEGQGGREGTEGREEVQEDGENVHKVHANLSANRLSAKRPHRFVMER